MGKNLFKRWMLEYFFANKDNSYPSSSISGEDKLILLKNDSSAGAYDVLVKISDIGTSISSSFSYLTLSNIDPSAIGNPVIGTYYMGIYNDYIWTKDNSGNIKWLYSQILQLEVGVSPGAVAGSNYADFSPIKLPANTKVERNYQAVDVNAYSIVDTKVVFDANLSTYEKINVYLPYTII